MESLKNFNRNVDRRIALAKAEESKRDEAFWMHAKNTEAYFRAAGLFTFLVLLILIFYGILLGFSEANKHGYLDGFKTLISNLFISFFGKILVISLIMMIGVVLFVFKKKQQLYYGIAETAFALASCFIVTENIQNSIAKHGSFFYIILSAMTAIYLIVRGLSNVFEGWSKYFFLKEVITKKDGWKDLIFKITEDKPSD
jgi:hypothetical protein